MKQYSIKQLAELAGVSVRTLHHYDHIGLLVPSVRTDAGYRFYEKDDLLKLQQVLFYRELGFTLQEIAAILEADDFDTIKALQDHKKALQAKRDNLAVLLTTIDKTIKTLKGEQIMMTDKELYEGFPKGPGYREEVIGKYGEQAVLQSENSIKKMGKEQWKQVQEQGKQIIQNLLGMMHKDPADKAVQQEIANHYRHILLLWGRSENDPSLPEAYSGLAQLYLDDERYTGQQGLPNREFALFISKAMKHFAGTL